ncbi:hypothetical protein CO2235_90294 [Cupriavidus oxalaticus]|uniref:Uncharacterized protein n=1 Tax=Cupriavidus oxalaticus TaxID=96344 RepID=A0A375GDF5_9BURK|nr:hypothetical protein CO2235_90294 [Cupriavidus oxalaticus]
MSTMACGSAGRFRAKLDNFSRIPKAALSRAILDIHTVLSPDHERH